MGFLLPGRFLVWIMVLFALLIRDFPTLCLGCLMCCGYFAEGLVFLCVAVVL